MSSVSWCYNKPFDVNSFLKYLQPSLDKGHLTNDGPLQAVLQSKVKNLVQCESDVLLCASGTAALHSLVSAYALKEEKSLRWVTQAFTFPTSIQGPLQSAIVFDNDEKYFGPSVKEMDARKEEFDGVIVTNLFGYQCDIEFYEEWCKKEGKLLVFDNAATPVGFLKDGRCIHDVGDGAMISLHETKPFGRGEGGAVMVKKDMIKFVHRAMNFGFDVKASVRIAHRLASNWRMSDFAAAALCNHLDMIDEGGWIAKFHDLVKRATLLFKEKNITVGVNDLADGQFCNTLFVKLPESCSLEPDELCKKLVALGIEAKHYYRPLSDEAPVAWAWYNRCICLPCHFGVTEEKLHYMLDSTVKYVNE